MRRDETRRTIASYAIDLPIASICARMNLGVLCDRFADCGHCRRRRRQSTRRSSGSSGSYSQGSYCSGRSSLTSPSPMRRRLLRHPRVATAPARAGLASPPPELAAAPFPRAAGSTSPASYPLPSAVTTSHQQPPPAPTPPSRARSLDGALVGSVRAPRGALQPISECAAIRSVARTGYLAKCEAVLGLQAGTVAKALTKRAQHACNARRCPLRAVNAGSLLPTRTANSHCPHAAVC